jgi:hypothetical protein
MLRKNPGIEPPIGGGSVSRDLRQRVSAEEWRFLPGLSLRANFGGHTSEEQMVLRSPQHDITSGTLLLSLVFVPCPAPDTHRSDLPQCAGDIRCSWVTRPP